MVRVLVRLFLRLMIAVAISAASTLAIAFAWNAIGGGAMSVHGWIALSLGLFGTVALTWGLMGLAFKSSREGWDARVDERLDPGPDAND